jgi:hypothetical protein
MAGEMGESLFAKYSNSLAKFKLVQKPHTNHTDIPLALSSTSKYFQMLPGPPGALQCALKLGKSILRCSWQHLQLWRCIQDAMRLTIRIVNIWSSWNLCTNLQETSRADEISVQICRGPGAIFWHQWFRGVAVGFIFILFFFYLCSVRSIFQLSVVSRDEG